MIEVNYSSLRKTGSYSRSWRDIFDGSFPTSIGKWLRQAVYLPYDHYDIITAYFLLPSALCRIVPYLFLCGQSGSGKSTIGKLVSKIYGIEINSSSDTFAAIRNSLNERKYGYIEESNPDSVMGASYSKTELNTCMVWDDVDPSTFRGNPDIYRMFKFGYDRSADKIMVSSDKVGENIEFHCFCPKIFSSVSSLHTMEDFRELHRRLLVVPTKKIEDMSAERQNQLGLHGGLLHVEPLSVDDIDWEGCDSSFRAFWTLRKCEEWLEVRKSIPKRLKGMTSNQRVIIFDLVTTGIVTGIWMDATIASRAMQTYFDWFDREREAGKSSLGQVLERVLLQEQDNASAIGAQLALSNRELRAQLDGYFLQGWLLEKPSSKTISRHMADLGYRLINGYWEKA